VERPQSGRRTKSHRGLMAQGGLSNHGCRQGKSYLAASSGITDEWWLMIFHVPSTFLYTKL
jgi:hypothetical protein